MLGRLADLLADPIGFAVPFLVLLDDLGRNPAGRAVFRHPRNELAFASEEDLEYFAHFRQLCHALIGGPNGGAVLQGFVP